MAAGHGHCSLPVQRRSSGLCILKIGMNAAAVGLLGNILRSTDGGTGWFELSYSVSDGILQAVDFQSLSNGTAVGQYGTFLRTAVVR